MTTYHPSVVVRLEVRLEEGARTAALDAGLKRKVAPSNSPVDVSPSSEAGKQAAIAQIDNELVTLGRQRSLMSQLEYDERAARLKAQRASLQGSGNDDVDTRPGAVGGAAPDQPEILGDIQPVHCRIYRNGLADADTFELELDFKDAPFDPRIVRSAFVEIVMGVVPSEQFAAGVAGALANGALASQVRRSDDDSTRERTKFFGFVDSWRVAYEGGDTVTLSGRSVESLLMTTDLPDDTSIDLTRPIVDGIRDLLNSFRETENMVVVFGNPNAPTTPGSGPVPAGSVARARKGRKGTSARRARSSDRQKMKLWDHITEVVGSVGLLAIVRGLQLYIADPRTFLLGEGKPFQLVYGRNIDELSMERKLGGTVKARTVEVRCYDSDIGKVRWARHPVRRGARASGMFPDNVPEPTRANEVKPSGVATDEVIVFRVKGIVDQAALEGTAASIFTQLGRQEIEGRVSTDEVTSFNGAEGDLLNLYPGDAIELLVAVDDTVPQGEAGTARSNLQQLQAQGDAQRAEWLHGIGWDADASRRWAAAQRDVADQQTVFRVAGVTISWRTASGFQIEVDYMNFLLAREEAGVAPARPPGAGAAALAGPGSSAQQEALRAASSAQQTLGAQAEAGEMSPDEFAAQGAQNDQDAAQAARNARNR